MGKLSCEAVNYLKVLLSVYSHLLARQSPEDLASVSQLRNGDTYDFIIVGGGTAGCVVANRLSEMKEWKILLLEAGGEEPQVSHIPAFGNNLKLTPLDWQFWTEPQKTACGGQPCQWPGGKVLGGGSAINDMIYNRGNKYDYEGWAKLGNTGWDYANVLPYFRKSEHNLDEDMGTNQIHHSTGGYQTISRFPHVDTNIQLMIKGFTDLGLKVVDFNGEQVLGAAHLQATQSGGERRSTNRAFLEPIRQHRKNLKIVTNVRVIKVLVKPGTKTAYGIKYVGEKDNTITGKIFAKKDVILSAGSINSPHILLLSGIGPKETLERLNIPVIKNLRVGYNLQDHVGASAVNFIVGNSTRPNKKDLIRDGFLYSKIPREGGWAGIGSLSVTSYFNSKYADTSIDFPDVQFSTIPSLADVKDQECDVDFEIPWCYYNRVTFMPSVLRPKSKGYLTINTTDPFKHPIIYAKYFDHPDDMKIMVDGFKLVAKLSETKTFIEHGFVLDKTSPRRCKHLKFGTDEYWICAAEETTHSNFHPVGTCKMGPSSDPEAVVDPKLHVYGIKHLRVIDSSIMPIVSSGNTNAPSIMIGEKGADLVKESYGIGLKEDDDAYQSVTDDYEEVQFTGDDIQLNTDFIDNNEENRQPKEDEFEIPAHEDGHEGHLHMRRKRSTQPEHTRIINEKLKKAGKLGGRRGEFEEGEEIEEKENGTGRNKGESEGEEEDEIKNEEEDEDENNFERRTKRSIQPNNRNGKKLMSGTELEGRKGKSEKIRGLEEDEKEKQQEGEEEAENEEDETGDEYNDEKEGREEEGDEYDEHDGGDDEKVSDEYEGVIGPKEDDDRHQTITVDNGETPVKRNEMGKDEEDIQNNLQTRTKRSIKSTHENRNKLKKGGEFGGKRGEFDDGEEVENKENIARMGRGHAGKKSETEEGEDEEEDENKDAKEENNSKRRTKRNIQSGRKHGKELKKNGKFRESKGEFEEEDEVEKKEFGAGSKKKQKRNRKHRSKKQESEEGEREEEENDSGEEDEENNSKKRTKRNIQTEHRNGKKMRKGEFEEGDEIEKKEFETGIKKKQKGNRKSEGKEEDSEEGGEEENENGEDEEEEEGEEGGEKEENNLKSRKKRSSRTKHTNERIKGEKLRERRGEFEEGEVENEEHSIGSKKKLKKRTKRGDKKEESEEGEQKEGGNDSGEDEEEEGKGDEKED